MNNFAIDHNRQIAQPIISHLAILRCTNRSNNGLNLVVSHTINESVQALPAGPHDRHLLYLHVWLIVSIELE